MQDPDPRIPQRAEDEPFDMGSADRTEAFRGGPDVETNRPAGQG